MVLIACVNTVYHEWRVHGSFKLLVWQGTVVSTIQRLLSFDLAERVLERCSLHMVKNTLLTDSGRAHG